MPPSDSILAPRRSPSARAEKLPEIDPRSEPEPVALPFLEHVAHQQQQEVGVDVALVHLLWKPSAERVPTHISETDVCTHG